MFDQFLTSVLQVVVVVDILGVIAYFVLSGLRSKTGVSEPSKSIMSYLPWRREPADRAWPSRSGQLPTRIRQSDHMSV